MGVYGFQRWYGKPPYLVIFIRILSSLLKDNPSIAKDYRGYNLYCAGPCFVVGRGADGKISG
jgi:hypothetical protein